MTEPVKMIEFGGLYVDENLVHSKVENQDGTFTINFKTGETITYPAQKTYLNESRIKYRSETFMDMKGGDKIYCDNAPETFKSTSPNNYLKPVISCSVFDGYFTDTSEFKIANVMGATFTSSKKNIDEVQLEHCYDCNIDLAANHSRIYGDSVDIEGGKGNEAILDKKDYAFIAGYNISGAGTAAQDSYDN